MFKIFGYLKNSIPQVLLIIVLLIIQAWGDLTLPQYTSDIVDIGIQNGGIENAAADALSVDGYNALEAFMNDEQKSILAKSYTLVKKGEATDSQKDRFPGSADNDVYFLNELTEAEKESQDAGQEGHQNRKIFCTGADCGTGCRCIQNLRGRLQLAFPVAAETGYSEKLPCRRPFGHGGADRRR